VCKESRRGDEGRWLGAGEGGGGEMGSRSLGEGGVGGETGRNMRD